MEINMETPNWVKKQLAKLNLNDEGKFLLFNGYAVKQYQKNIDAANRNIDRVKSSHSEKLSELQEELVELQDAFNDSIQNAPLDKILTVDVRKEFFLEFNAGLDAAEKAITDKQVEIEQLISGNDSELAKFSKVITVCEKRIELLK